MNHQHLNMKSLHTLICFFFLSALLDENTVCTLIISYIRVEGEDVTVNCSFSSPGTRKIFCKDTCEGDDVLIETTGNGARSGRYSIEYDGEGFLMTMTQLTKSDTGYYWCGLDAPSSPTLYKKTEICVVDALLGVDGYQSEETYAKLYTKPGSYVTIVCYFPHPGKWRFFCKEECEGNDVLVETDGYRAHSGRYSIRYLKELYRGGSVHVTISQLTESDSGWYWCGLNTSSQGFEIIVANAPSSSDSSTRSSALPGITPTAGQQQSERISKDTVVLYVGVSLVIIALLSPVAVLIFCRKRFCKPTDSETRGNIHDRNMQIALHENDPPSAPYAVSAYQNLHPATRDPAHTYSPFRHAHITHQNF